MADCCKIYVEELGHRLRQNLSLNILNFMYHMTVFFNIIFVIERKCTFK